MNRSTISKEPHFLVSLIRIGFGRVRPVWGLITETFDEWQRDNAMRLAASLSFYTVLSMAPLLFVVLAIGTFVVGQSAAQSEILAYIRRFAGADSTNVVVAVSQRAQEEFSNRSATLLGIVTVLFGATAVFAELKSTLNTTWNVMEKPGSNWKIAFIRTRLIAFGMVLMVGSLLVISLLASAVLSALSHFFGTFFLPVPSSLLQLVNFAVSFGILTLTFAMTYKVLPDVRIRWRDVWVGAAITSLLFTSGKTLIGMYIGRSILGSVYGTAGSLVLILLWVYYSAQVFLFGAEFTQVYARKHGLRIEPTHNAIRVPSSVNLQ